MPTYEIEQYELHTERYRVEADDVAHAIAGLLNGEADPVEGSLEYIEVAEDFGEPVDEYQDLADRLRDLGITIHGDIIPSIRSIQQVE
jgi:hypothetical protein